MNVFTRFWQIIKANVNALLERFENPERSLEQAIRDMQKQVTHIREDVIKIAVEEKRLKQLLSRQQDEVKRWERNAMLALKEGKENLAREALSRKQEAVEMSDQLRPQWEQQVKISERLKSEYHELRERIKSAQRRKRNLVTRLRHANTQQQLQGMLADLDDSEAFERFENKLAETEAMNAAQEELQEMSLDQQFAALGTAADMDVEQELEAMKQRLELNS